MIKHMLSGVAIIGLAACSPPEEAGDDVGVEALAAPALANTSPPRPPEPPQPDDSGAVTYENNTENNGATREFLYAWPAQVSAIPELAKMLVADRDAQLASQKSDWTVQAADCPADITSCRSNDFNLNWQVVADLPGYLSLSNNLYTYGGGAHGNYRRDALIWDRDKRERLNPKAMFTSLDSLDAAISERACALLDAEREERRGEPVVRGDWPSQCVSMEETVLFLGSSGGKTFDRLGIYYAPYIAGPYAEGEFEFTLPVTKAVIEAVKPEYRAAFSLAKR